MAFERWNMMVEAFNKGEEIKLYASEDCVQGEKEVLDSCKEAEVPSIKN